MPTYIRHATAQDDSAVIVFDSLGLDFRSQRRVEPVTLVQSVRVEAVNGATVSTFSPSNEDLLAEAQTMAAPPAFVYRHMSFCGDIPKEYAWVIPHKDKPGYGGFGEQRMTYTTWRRALPAERETGHAGPTGQANLARKKAKGD